MSELKKRLDNFRKLLDNDDFLQGKGLSNEVNIRIFCYEPDKEMEINNFINQLKVDTDLKCNLIECDLYSIFLEICEDIDILEAIPTMEIEDGTDYLLEQLNFTINEYEFVQKIKNKSNEKNEVLMITGVGDIFPFMRAHSLLETLQPHFSDTPILVMYPGEFTGYALTLFNILKSNDYYRAFNLI